METRPMSLPILARAALVLGTASLAACGGDANGTAAGAAAVPPVTALVRDTLLPTVVDAAGSAEPVEQATLSTKLMGAVQRVAVQEGDVVEAGALLVKIDARDIDARRGQAAAQLAQAEAAHREAQLMAQRIRALYADSAAPRAQLDAVEAGLTRAEAAVNQARAGLAEVDAMGGYAEVRAPFAGTVTRRFVDPGAFAAPGAPLVTVENGSRLRVAASAAPETVRRLRRGTAVDVRIEDQPARGTVEGVVPAGSGATYTVNVIVENPGRRFLPHSAATLAIPAGEPRRVAVVPAAAVARDGDLTGVRLVREGKVDVRWVRLGRQVGTDIEVLAGVAAGDAVVVPAGAH
jgi:RND family efflux transporter MFP subunit